MNQTAFKRLLDFYEAGMVRIVLAEVVIREAKEKSIPRIAKEIATAHAAHVAALGGESLTAEQITGRLLKQFEELCERAETVQPATAATVLDHYFQGFPPFGTGSKRNEFPDAFALLALKDWANEHGELHVVSSDPDWRKACDAKLRCFRTLEDWLSHVLKASGDVANVSRISQAIRSQIVELDQIKAQIEATAEVGIFSQGRMLNHNNEYYFEAHAAQIEPDSVQSVSVYDIERRDDSDSLMEFAATVELLVRVRINCEVDNPDLTENPMAVQQLERVKTCEFVQSLHVRGTFDSENSEVTLSDVHHDNILNITLQLDQAPGGRWFLKDY